MSRPTWTLPQRSQLYTTITRDLIPASSKRISYSPAMKAATPMYIIFSLVSLVAGASNEPHVAPALSEYKVTKRAYEGEFVANEYQKDIDTFTDEEVFGRDS